MFRDRNSSDRSSRSAAIALALVLSAAAWATACSGDVPSGTDAGSALRPTATGVMLPPSEGRTGCTPASPKQTYGSVSTEIQGVANHGNTLWARVAGHPPFKAGRSIQILFAITGIGRAHVVAEGADGSQVLPQKLYLSQSSSWMKPGADWSALMLFPSAGCWRVNVVHGGAYGDIWLHITT